MSRVFFSKIFQVYKFLGAQSSMVWTSGKYLNSCEKLSFTAGNNVAFEGFDTVCSKSFVLGCVVMVTYAEKLTCSAADYV